MPFFVNYLLIFGCAGSSLLTGFSLVATSGGYSLVAMHGLLIAVASLIVEHSTRASSPHVGSIVAAPSSRAQAQ